MKRFHLVFLSLCLLTFWADKTLVVHAQDPVLEPGPAPAMKPMMVVAVRNTPIKVCAGMIPISVSGIGAMITRGTRKDWNHATTMT